VTPADDDALQRVTRLARQSLEEAELIVGERRITPEQRRAWQEAARRYWQTARRSVQEREATRSHPMSALHRRGECGGTVITHVPAADPLSRFVVRFRSEGAKGQLHRTLG
jgi:hypothetical protein